MTLLHQPDAVLAQWEAVTYWAGLALAVASGWCLRWWWEER